MAVSVSFAPILSVREVLLSDGGLACLYARDLTIGIYRGDSRVARFPGYLLIGCVLGQDGCDERFISADINIGGGLVECYARNRYGSSLDGNLAGSSLASVLGGDGDGGLACLYARDLAVGINGGDFRLIRFPRYILVGGVFPRYILVGGVFWKDSSGKGFITTDKKARFALVECYARNRYGSSLDGNLAGGGLAAVVGGDGDGGLACLYARDLTIGIYRGDSRVA